MNYIAHIYWRIGVEREKVLRFRVTLGDMGCNVGDMKEEIQTPHPFPRYDIYFTEDIKDNVVNFLKLNFDKMAVAIRPDTGNLAEDFKQVIWTGKEQIIKL